MQVNKKKVAFDVLLNIVASMVPIAVMQLIIYPLVLKETDSEEYGVMITAFSILTVVSNTLGNALNNIRLLNQPKYEEQNIEGDFNILLFIELIINTTIIMITSIFMFKQITLIDVVLITLIGILFNLYSYIYVVFRIALDYKAIVINNIILVIGYLLGFGIFLVCKKWQLIYIVGYFLAIIYICRYKNLFKEKLARTVMFRKVATDTLWLLLSGILNSLLNYADRILIYPMLGGEAVTIYYIANLFGKIIGMVVGPMNSVVLSYIAKIDKLSQKFLSYIVAVTTFIGVIGYVLCMSLGKLGIKILYADYYEEVVRYLPITTVTAMLMMAISVVFPFVIKCCSMKWQVVIDAVALACYVILGIVLYNAYGFMGFCIGVMIAFVAKLIIMLYLLYNKRQEHVK